MKTYLILLVSFCPLLIFTGCKEMKSGNQPAEYAAVANNTSPIDGAWELVWEDVAGAVKSTGKPTQIKLFADGYFSYLMQDSTGKWSNAGAGTFELSNDGKTYKETMLYHSVPAYVGATDWQEYELQGDTLIFKLFTKVVMQDGTDRTADFPKTIEKRVRAGAGKQSSAHSSRYPAGKPALLVQRVIGVRKI